MTKKVIISISIILNVVLIMAIFLPDKANNRIEKKYEKTDKGQRLYVETKFDYNNNRIYEKTIIDSKLFKEGRPGKRLSRIAAKPARRKPSAGKRRSRGGRSK